MAGGRNRYQRAWLRWDLLAGVTTAAVVVPQAVAYASLAGLPVQVGLYVAIVPMVVYALIGTSRPLSVSSTSTLSILTAGALADAGAAGTARGRRPPPRCSRYWSAASWWRGGCCAWGSWLTSSPRRCWPASRPGWGW